MLRDLKARHETEMEPLSTRIDSLQLQLEEAMKTRQVFSSLVSICISVLQFAATVHHSEKYTI